MGLTTALGLMPAWLWRVIAYGLLVLAILGFGFYEGCEHDAKELTDYIAKESTAATKIAQAQTKVVVMHEYETINLLKTVHANADTIAKEIAEYVPPKNASDDAGGVPNGFVRVFDAGASNSPVAGPPDSSDEAPSGYSLAQVAAASAANGETLATCRVQLNEAISFYNDVKKTRGEAVANLGNQLAKPEDR